ncbi:hypothetical protein UFOVP376_2 [uncultured Caudovirales phage]|uniref:Uncharacterized protein n=1 Tax=uncultured Caudovirales phage TaxID=2100421 RepID=A0A6J7WXC3_9CAUD|nr:hypothetical protein UFOVP376_2 [uncultured Caudovirales phage]
MADNIRATPRNPVLGLFSDITQGGLDYLRDPRFRQAMMQLPAPVRPFGMGAVALPGLFESTGFPKTLERAAYGEPLTNIGMANVPTLKPETADLLMNVAPLAPAALRGAAATGRFVAPKAGQLAEQYMVRTGGILPLDVYHGTPHTLPPTPRNPLGEFDASKIGTGEGAQSYGHGIYTAENPDVAKSYQFMEQNWFDTSKAKYKGKSIDSWYEQAQKDQERAFRTNNKVLEKDATARLAYWENIMTHNHPENVLKQFTDPEYGWDEAANYAKSIDLNKFSGVPRSGNLYKADLPDEMIAKMLDWDKPLSQQSENVQQALAQLGYVSDKNKIGQFDDALLAALQGGSTDLPKQPLNLTGEAIYRKLGSPQAASEKLKQLGIPGIKYFDEGSRTAGTGTRNFVTFPGEEQNLRILERNSQRANELDYPSNPMYTDPLGYSIR